MHFLEDPVQHKYVLTDELSFQVLSEHSGVSFACLQTVSRMFSTLRAVAVFFTIFIELL